VTPKDRFSPFEFALVICTAFGWYIFTAVYSLFASLGEAVESSSQAAYGNTHLLGVALYEGLITPVLLAILYVRGWRIDDFRPVVSARTTAFGVALAVAAFALFWAIGSVLALIYPVARAALDASGSYQPSAGPGLAAVLLVSLINPVFEEVFVCAYVIEALRPRFGETTAINVSVAIRTSYHLYQGISAFPFHCAYGLLQSYTYVRYGKLWPLIVCHAILDFVALVRLT